MAKKTPSDTEPPYLTDKQAERAEKKFCSSYDNLLTEKELAYILHLPVKDIARIAAYDVLFPVPMRISATARLYSAAQLRIWFTANERQYYRPERRTQPPQKPNKVYFIQCESFVKIGFTNNVGMRMSALKIATPYPIKLLGTIDGGQKEESELHKRFAEHRVRPDGEWFRLVPDLLAFIESVASK